VPRWLDFGNLGEEKRGRSRHRALKLPFLFFSFLSPSGSVYREKGQYEDALTYFKKRALPFFLLLFPLATDKAIFAL